MMRDPVIDVRNVSTTLGGHSIHRDLSLSVAHGEVIALIGGSGSGKSVLMREIIGLLRPQAGRIELLRPSPAQHRHHRERLIRELLGRKDHARDLSDGESMAHRHVVQTHE